MIGKVYKFIITLIKAICTESLSVVFKWITTVITRVSQNGNPLADGIPWMSYRVTDWLNLYLNKGMRVFEYGSGASTVFFAERVKEVVSVEHNRNAHRIVGDALRDSNIRNLHYILKERSDSKQNKGPHSSFDEYVKTIDAYPDNYFDIVIVDGRARCLCLNHGVNKVRPGGYILLDDSDRSRYNECKEALNDWKPVMFYGIAPFKLGMHETTIWEKPTPHETERIEGV
jgi:hypothetical protein